MQVITRSFSALVRSKRNASKSSLFEFRRHIATTERTNQKEEEVWTNLQTVLEKTETQSHKKTNRIWRLLRNTHIINFGLSCVLLSVGVGGVLSKSKFEDQRNTFRRQKEKLEVEAKEIDVTKVGITEEIVKVIDNGFSLKGKRSQELENVVKRTWEEDLKQSNKA
jgi:hypothetical protein